jgi:hypothetical protein
MASDDDSRILPSENTGKGKKDNEKQSLLDPICSLQSLNRTLRRGMDYGEAVGGS